MPVNLIAALPTRITELEGGHTLPGAVANPPVADAQLVARMRAEDAMGLTAGGKAAHPPILKGFHAPAGATCE